MMERAFRRNETKYTANRNDTIPLPHPSPLDAPVLNAQKLNPAPSPMETSIKKTWKAFRDISRVGV